MLTHHQTILTKTTTMNDLKIEQLDRKKFLRTAGSTALFAFLGIGMIGCGDSTSAMEDNIVDKTPDDGDGGGSGISISNNGNTITIDLTASDVTALNNIGGWLLINGANTLVLNVGDSVMRAFTSVCTHSGCSDSWQFSNSLFECTCHGSRFNTSGEVVRGPANRDLAEFSVSRNDDIVRIIK